ncbi:MAG: sterol-binding protein [Myxococcales bacterium SG8_38]|nr:MAG: sterol-binding protein [Myxococcales bacterium SG8_38]
MGTELRYLSPEWRDEAEKRLRTELSAERMNFVTSSMSNVYLNCPDGGSRYLVFRFENGELAELLLGQGEPPTAEFKITGQYETFARITRAELSSHRALMTGKLKLKGNMVKALKLAAIADRMNKVLSKIPASY